MPPAGKMKYQHVPVLRERLVELIAMGPGGIVVDATVGLGGHAEAILEQLPEVRVVGFDVDPQALEHASERLSRFAGRVQLVHGSYARLDEHLHELGIESVGGVLLDCGVSSLQIDAPSRGFSYRVDGPLDMRMDPSSGSSAAAFLAAADEKEIARVLREYGEEPQARRIARAIVERRRRAPLLTTADLVDVVQRTVSGRKPVSTLARVFQGVRVAVNRELENLRQGLRRALGVLAPGSIFAVLSYHSLEDRAVKQFFRQQVEGCVCPPDLPQCACGFVSGHRLLTRRAIRPTAEEIESNPRARSARLRALQRAA
jgi:16S rRNA (cytosine1402-N4)-methyltransferase